MNEFEIIQHFFNKKSDVIVGIGDDAAIVHIPQEFELAITVDTLVENIHFLPSMPPHALGFKSLAVNLSDLAAMGATPKWITLALTMPEYHSSWLEEFSRGLFELANRFGVQ